MKPTSSFFGLSALGLGMVLGYGTAKLFRPVAVPEIVETNEIARWDTSDSHPTSDSPTDSGGETRETHPTPMEFKKLTLDQIKAKLDTLHGAPVTPESDRMEQRLVERWAELDPLSAATYAAQAVDAGAPDKLLQAVMAIWAKSDPVAASAWAVSLSSPDLREKAVRQIYRTWSATDPGTAATSLSRLPKGSSQTIAAEAIGENYAQTNLTQALEWTKTLTGAVRNSALRAVLGKWTQTDPQGAAKWIVQQGYEIQWSAVQRLASDWVRKDPSTALAYGTSLAGSSLGSKLGLGPIQRRFMESALNTLISSDPRGAATWLATPSGSTYFNDAAPSVAGRWASFSPPEALAWTMQIQDAKTRNSAIASLASSWTRNDPTGAARWIQTLGNGAARDNALSSYARTLSSYDPLPAAQSASSITDPKIRDNAMQIVMKNWRRYDPVGAANFTRNYLP